MKHSTRSRPFILTLAVGVLLAETASALITIETVPVGNACNAADPTTGCGAVGYAYGVGKYEVTLNQYAAFLNAVAVTDTYGLYRGRMGSDQNIAGISRSGTSGSYTYSVIGSGGRPVSYVSWYDAARFVNWLQNGQPTGAQVAGITETGAYTLTGNSGTIMRNPNWTYGLPSDDEWYKAAYYDPTLNAGSGGYWPYPTRNDAIPNSRNGSVTDPNSANFYEDDGIANGFNDGFAVTGSTTYSQSQQYLTDVGAFSLADSFYGTFDQAGNVWEWNDAVMGVWRGLRGGSWYDPWRVFHTLPVVNGRDPTYEVGIVGFRVVIVPEPGAFGIMVLGIAMLACRRKRTVRPLVLLPFSTLPCAKHGNSRG